MGGGKEVRSKLIFEIDLSCIGAGRVKERDFVLYEYVCTCTYTYHFFLQWKVLFIKFLGLFENDVLLLRFDTIYIYILLYIPTYLPLSLSRSSICTCTCTCTCTYEMKYTIQTHWGKKFFLCCKIVRL